MNVLIERTEKCNTKKVFNPRRIFKIANIMVLTLMFILGISSTGVYASELKDTPFGAIVKGVENASKVNTAYSTSKVTMTLDTSMSKDPKVKMISNVIKNISIESKVKTNTITKEAFYDMVFKFNDVATLNAKMYMKDQNNIVISIPELYNRPIYYSVNDIYSSGKNKGINLNTLNMDDYKALFTMDKSKELQDVNEKYGKMLNDSLNQLVQPKEDAILNIENINGQKSQLKCNQYALNMTLNDVSSIVNNFMTKISEDANFKNYVKVKLDEFFAIVDKNNHYANFNLTKEDANKIKTNFDKSYTTIIEGIKSSVNKMNQECEAKITSNMLIDSNKILRGSKSEINIKVKDLFVLNMTSEGVVNSINESMAIDTISSENALNLFKASKAEQDDMAMQMQTNMVKIFGSFAPVKK